MIEPLSGDQYINKIVSNSNVYISFKAYGNYKPIKDFRYKWGYLFYNHTRIFRLNDKIYENCISWLKRK